MAEHQTYRAAKAFGTTNRIISKILFASLLISRYTAVAAFSRPGLSFRPKAAFVNYRTTEKGFAPSLQFSEIPISIGIQQKNVNDKCLEVPFMYSSSITQHNKAVTTNKVMRKRNNKHDATNASALTNGLHFSSIINVCLVRSPIEFRFIYQPFLILFYWPFYAIRKRIVSARFPSISSFVTWCLASSPIELRFLYQPFLIMFYWPFYALRSLIGYISVTELKDARSR